MKHNVWHAKIDFTDANGATEQIDGLHNTYIRSATEKINSPIVAAAFTDQRGIVRGWHAQDVALTLDPHAPLGVGISLVSPTEAPAATHLGAEAALGSAFSAEYRPPIPDGPAATELLPTSDALLQLIQSDQATASARLNDPVSAIISHVDLSSYGRLDPYAMGWASIDNAVRSLLAHGVQPNQIVLLTEFAWDQDHIGDAVRCVQGCHDAAVAYRTPIVVNQVSVADQRRLQVRAVGLLPNQPVPQQFTQAGHKLYIFGDTKAEVGGTRYAELHNESGGIVPQGLTEGLLRYRALHRAIRGGWVTACAPILNGGLGIAVAQMAISSSLGAQLQLRPVPGTIAHDDLLLFSETIGRFLVEVPPEHENQFNFQIAAEPHAQIGVVSAESQLQITGYDDEVIIDLSLADLNL